MRLVKELGFANFSKPDTYLKQICQPLRLTPSRDDWVIFLTVSRISHNVGGAVTPFNVDKLFWLIGSGLFNRPRLSDLRWGGAKPFLQYAAIHLPWLQSHAQGKEHCL